MESVDSMDEEKTSPNTAIVLSYIGGALILVAGIITLGVGTTFMYGMMGRMMYGYGTGPIGPLMAGMGILGIIFGAIVIIGAYMIGSSPVPSHTSWGIIILLFSAMSFISGGGFYIGGVLGIIGGILAIIWKPATVNESPKIPDNSLT